MHVLSGTVFCQGMDGLLRGLKHCSLLRDLILSTKLICMLMGPYTLYGDVHRVLYREMCILRDCMVRSYCHYLASMHVC